MSKPVGSRCELDVIPERAEPRESVTRSPVLVGLEVCFLPKV